MKRLPLALASLVLATRAALAADPAELSVYLFDQQTPLADAEVRIDGAARGRTSADGALAITIEPGRHTLTVVRDGDDVLALEIELKPEENAELIATLYPDSAPSVFIESSHQDGNAASSQATQAAAGPPGTLAGRVVSSEDGKPVANARVFVAGTPLDIVTDAEGRYSAPITAGTYSISVIAPEFSSQTIEGVAIVAEQTTEKAIELTPSGVELPEFVVLEPFVEGSLAAFVEEKRTSSAVADILGAEQISRAGDSDAAGALKRVTGLTLVDGKFVYVRGLGERYSSVVLNGAQIPSPDPTRRVVPLDLFPVEILNGIVVQKTYTADMPGEFGGGTIQLRTRGVPEAFLLRASGTLGYGDGTTGEEGLRYQGGHRDWTGFDDGAREAPEGLLGSSLPTDPMELERLGESVAEPDFALSNQSIGPNTGASVSVGDDFRFNEGAWSLGYIASLRHSQTWDSRNELRAGFSTLSTGQLVPLFEFQRNKTERAIDSGLFVSSGLRVGEHHNVTATVFQVRQTVDQAQVDDGLQSSGNIERLFQLEWIENELTTRQLGGEHSLVALGNLVVGWQYTGSDASRYSPNTREYNFSFDELDDEYYYNGQNFIRFDALDDAVDQARIDLKWPWTFNDADSVTVLAGVDRVERDRQSEIQRFAFRGGRPPLITDIDDLLRPENIFQNGSGGLRLQRATQPTDSYTASQTLDAFYLVGDLVWGKWRANLGMREESNDQQVVTQPLFDPDGVPVVAAINETDRLPSASVTWAYSSAAQVRLGYSETLSRPDFRELSEAPFIDPLLDIRVLGNPSLVQAEITSRDVRWEYYFTATESLSVAYFEKDFLNPIELVRLPASGELLGIRNAQEANNKGIELDLYKSFAGVEKLDWLPEFLRGLPWSDVFLGVNYAKIESEIDLGDSQGTQTNARRPLQGQSPYVGNVSLSYQHPQGKVEATLLYNVSGARISQVGDSGLPDIYEQPFDQLDFNVSAALPWEGWKLKVRLRNLLDPDAQFTVGDEITRSYKKGREVALNLEWKY